MSTSKYNLVYCKKGWYLKPDMGNYVYGCFKTRKEAEEFYKQFCGDLPLIVKESYDEDIKKAHEKKENIDNWLPVYD